MSNQPKSNLARRFLLILVVVGFFSALVNCWVNMVHERNRTLAIIDEHFTELEKSSLPPLILSAWTANTAMVQALLDDIAHRSYMSYAELTLDTGQVLSSGNPVEGKTFRRAYPLSHPFEATIVPVGSLIVEASLQEMDERVLSVGWILFVSKFVEIVISILIILSYFHFYIYRRVHKIFAFAEEISCANLDAQLDIPFRRDELDALALAMEKMRRSLVKSIAGKDNVLNALKRANERVSIATVSGGIGVWEYQLDKEVMTWDVTMRRIYDYHNPQEEISVDLWKSFLHPDDQETTVKKLNAAIARNDEFDTEFRIITVNGDVRYIKAASKLVVDRGRNPCLMIGVNIDITKQKISEMKAIENDQKFRLAFNSSPDAVNINRLQDGLYVAINEGFTRLTGFTAEDTIGKTSYDIDIWGDLNDRNTLVECLSKRGYCDNLEAVFRKKDGSVTTALMSARVIRIDGVDHIISITRDISGKIQTEKQLKTALAKAEEASRAKSEFLANMSHEIRTPLNGILGMLHLLEGSQFNQEQADYIEKALYSGKRLTSLLTDILDVSAIEAGKLSLSYAEVDVARVVESVTDLLAITAQQRGLEIRVEISSAIPQLIISDEVRLRQILFNLTGNGLKFTQSGFVSIQADFFSSPGLKISNLLIIVSDTGPGISDGDLATVFESFGQISQGYTKEHQGAGLGLPIVKRIVDLMGGTICVDSNIGQGTSIYVSIPVKRQMDKTLSYAVEDMSTTISKAVSDMKGRIKILLVEDDPSNSFALTRLLGKEGYDVKLATDGKEAIELLKANEFDMVLMDIQMPEMNGLEATQTIREGLAGGNNRKVPIIAITAYAMADDESKFLNEGMDGYIEKPVSIKRLLSLIHSIIIEK